MAPGAWAAMTCNVREYGAVGDGKTKDTTAIQKAVDTCAGKGGGTVWLEGGTFVTGPVLLKSNITLFVAKGAVLLGSPDMADFGMVEFARHQTRAPLVSAVNAEHVTITGGGTIDGNGKVWWDYVRGAKDGGRARAMTIRGRWAWCSTTRSTSGWKTSRCRARGSGRLCRTTRTIWYFAT